MEGSSRFPVRRELAYDTATEKSRAGANRREWTVVSMKSGFRAVF